MKKLFLLSTALLCLGAFASASSLPCNGGQGSAATFNLPCVFYGGDLDLNDPNQTGVANENDAIVFGIPYGAASFQNFVWGGGQIAGLFTNNQSSLTPTSAYYEIRLGVSEGNGGTLITSGTATGANFLQTATGRSFAGYSEYTDAVRFNAMNLPAGTYWFAVVPVCPTCPGRSFNSSANTRLNGIGTDMDGQQFGNSPFFLLNFMNSTVNVFSSGVIGSTVPEPSSLIMLGSGLVAVAGVVRRRLF